MEGNSSPESPHPHKNILRKIADRLKTSTQNSHPTLEDQLKAKGMPYGSNRPTTQEQARDYKFRELENSFKRMSEIAEEISHPPGGWHEFERDAYKQATAEGRIEEAEAYRKMLEARIRGDTREQEIYHKQFWNLSQERLRKQEPKKPFLDKLTHIFRRK